MIYLNTKLTKTTYKIRFFGANNSSLRKMVLNSKKKRFG